MEGAASRPDNTPEALSDASLDLDLMDELLSEDTWLGAPEMAELLQRGASTPLSPVGSSYLSSPFKLENRALLSSSYEREAHWPDVKTVASSKDPPLVEAEMDKDMIDTQLISPSTRGFSPYPAQANAPGKAETSTGWSMEPRSGSGPFSSLKDRLNQALGFIEKSQRDGDVLVQIWVPINKGDRQVLTTRGQPFSLNPNSQRLMSYRHVSTGYQFSAGGDSGEALGLPGRVFLGKLPEWSPDVRYFSRYEYPRVNYAQHYDVRGTLALPIFERGGRTCLGVVEVVMTNEKINYRSDIEHICNALQAVDLRSSEVLSVQHVKMKSSDSYLAALPEISAVSRAVCRTHGLPLAQTWMPCIQQGRRGSRHSEENYNHCVSTLDGACFVNDPSLSSFHEACSEHHMLRGQGVVGRALTTNQPCFSPDITALSKTEYPLSHHARMFRLRAAVAVRLRSVDTGKTDFVLEFFLPMDCVKSEEQKAMLKSLSSTMQQVCWSLRVVTSQEQEDDTALQANEQLPSDGSCGKSLNLDNGSTDRSSPSWIASVMEAQPKEKTPVLPAYASLEFGKQELGGFSVTNYWGRSEMECSRGSVKDNIQFGDSLSDEPSFSSRGKAAEKKRTRMEKAISLQVLQRYFTGSLKDAAKSIGVCPTTLKRICRHHGITRWPSRKIKKVGHSLRKLQVVIDSIQGVDSSFQLSSLYANIPKDNGGSDQCKETATSTACGQDDVPESSNAQHGHFTALASASSSLSSSCSQSSGSSHYCSSGTKQCGHATNIPVKEEVPKEDQNSVVMLKRTRSEVELRHAGQQKTPKALARSQSLKLFEDNPAGCESTLSPCRKCADGLLRVKAMYGKEKIRFRLQPSWCLQELKQEIAKRFSIGSVDAVALKYLDDDSEWVLLTCDADLQECTDIYRSTSTHTIKISVYHVAQKIVLSSGVGSMTT